MDGSAGNSLDVEIPRSITGPNDVNGHSILTAWLAFQIASGSVGLPILILTFLFAKNVQRHPMLINMCITWAIAGLSSTLLFYARKERGPEPSKPLCIAQASLLYGAPPMTSLSAFAVVYQVWTTLNSMSRIEPKRGRIVMYFMLVMPYLALIGFATATAVIASRNPDKVNRARRFFYCSVEFGKLSNAMGAFAAIICFFTLIFEAHVAILLSRNLRGLRQAPPGKQNPGWCSLDVQLIGRIFVFSGYLVISLVFSAVSIMRPRTIVPDMFAATMGLAVFLVFGTQPDILRTWAFWLPKQNNRSLDTTYTNNSPRDGDYLDSTFYVDFRSTGAGGTTSVSNGKKLLGTDTFVKSYGSEDGKGDNYSAHDSDSFSDKGSRWSSGTEDYAQAPKVGAGNTNRVVVPPRPPFALIRRPEDAFVSERRTSAAMQYGLAL